MTRKSLPVLIAVFALPMAGVLSAKPTTKTATASKPAAKKPAAGKTADKPAASKPASAKPVAPAAPAAGKARTADTKPAAPKGAQGAVGPMAPLPRVYAPTRPREVQPKYPWRENITTTIFWIGESPTENNPTPNHKSSWDTEWQKNYGGYDDPNRENRAYDFRPKAFVPKLNPFYIALPFNDKTNEALAKAKIPWYGKRAPCPASGSYCRGVWIAIRFGNKTCFAQWEDCGPFETSDASYVFGGTRPKTQNNNGAGLDVSPAVRDFLGLTSGAPCDWRFCSENEVPDGPWTRYGANNSFLTKEKRELDALRARYAELAKKRDEWLLKHNR